RELMRDSDFDSLGVKVQRAEYALERVRGVGEVDGVRVVVDARNQLVELSIPGANAILAAYRAALEDLRPRLDEALRELHADSRFDAISTFVQANSSRPEEERRQYTDDDRSTPHSVESAW
ncbi:hypothetical protein ACW9HQ_53265, partial [Nocardia gipuzkoensis]